MNVQFSVLSCGRYLLLDADPVAMQHTVFYSVSSVFSLLFNLRYIPKMLMG